MFPADRGHHVPAPEWEGCRVSSARSASLAVPVGRSGWPVLVPCRSWLLPGSSRCLRECFSLTSETDKGADPITVHFCQARPGNYCSGVFFLGTKFNFEILWLCSYVSLWMLWKNSLVFPPEGGHWFGQSPVRCLCCMCMVLETTS